MHVLFPEDFRVKKNKIPGNWFIEHNSDLRMPAAKCDGRSMQLLSAGNKYIPVMPSVENAELRMRISFNFEMAGGFEGIVAFRYDTFKRRGDALRFIRCRGERGVLIEYGEMRDNKFSARQEKRLDVPDNFPRMPVDIAMSLRGGNVSVEFAGKDAVCRAEPPPGREKSLSAAGIFLTY